MPQKNRLKRKKLIYYLQVFDRNTNKLAGRLLDITTEGIMLISDNPIQTDNLFQFRMVLPKELGKGPEISFDVKSIWSKRDNNPDLYDTGFQLVNVSENDIEIIESLIKWFKF